MIEMEDKMNKCYKCRYQFTDMSVGYEECTASQLFTDAQDDEYCNKGFIENCPFFEEDERYED